MSPVAAPSSHEPPHEAARRSRGLHLAVLLTGALLLILFLALGTWQVQIGRAHV